MSFLTLILGLLASYFHWEGLDGVAFGCLATGFWLAVMDFTRQDKKRSK